MLVKFQCSWMIGNSHTGNFLRRRVGKDFIGFVMRIGKRRLDGVENEAPFEFHLLQRFTQLHHGGNDAAEHRKQARHKEHRGQKSGGRKKPARDQGKIRMATVVRKNSSALRISRARSVT
jgi:hypothetical protein